MNPLRQAEIELTDMYAAIDALHKQYRWLAKNGTGWLPEHYGVSTEVWRDVHAEAKRLDTRVSALRREIARLQRVSGARRGTTIHAHR